MEPLALGRDHVAEREAGDPVEGDLRERDHAAVRREEDQAGRGDPDEERLREDEPEPVVVEERRADRDEDERAHADRALDGLLRRHAEDHPALPKSPCGRNARTRARRTNVTMIEYWVQQLSPVVGRYTAENEKTSP